MTATMPMIKEARMSRLVLGAAATNVRALMSRMMSWPYFGSLDDSSGALANSTRNIISWSGLSSATATHIFPQVSARFGSEWRR